MLAAGVIAAMEFDSLGREPVRTGANPGETRFSEAQQSSSKDGYCLGLVPSFFTTLG